MVDVGSHCHYHRREPSCLSKVGDDLSALDSGVVVFVDKHRGNHSKNLVDVWPHEFVELVQNSIHHFDEQVTLLVFEGLRHEQREDLMEKGSRAELPCVESQLPQSTLSHLRRAVLDLQEECEDLSFLLLLNRQVLFIDVFQELGEVCVLFRFNSGEVALSGSQVQLGYRLRLAIRHLIPLRLRSRMQQRAYAFLRLVVLWGLYDFEAVLWTWQQHVQLFICVRAISFSQFLHHSKLSEFGLAHIHDVWSLKLVGCGRHADVACWGCSHDWCLVLPSVFWCIAWPVRGFGKSAWRHARPHRSLLERPQGGFFGWPYG